MKRINLALITIVLSLSLAGAAFGGESASHRVTVRVLPVDQLSLSGGDQTLTIRSAPAGQEPTPALNANTGLSWTTNQENRKITVSADAGYTTCVLKVVATGVSGGQAASEVVLADAASHDFVTEISRTAGGCTIQYTGEAQTSAGYSQETHTITYTLTGDG